MSEKLSTEKERELIAGRILDEYRKHNSIPNWHEIAALKLHRQWDEYYTKLMGDAINAATSQYKAKVDELEMIVNARDAAVKRLTEINAEQFNELTYLKQEKERLVDLLEDCINGVVDSTKYEKVKNYLSSLSKQNK